MNLLSKVNLPFFLYSIILICISAFDIGDLTQVRIETLMEADKGNPDWFLERFSVVSNQFRYDFAVNKWFSDSKGDCRRIRSFDVQCPQESTSPLSQLQ